MAGTKVGSSGAVAIAMAIVGRNARACDVCATKGAHWFCAADDAYLCTACDTQVHSANALSRRHERVRLSPSGTSVKASAKDRSTDGSCAATHKKLHPSPPQVAPVRKRSRTARPYAHHLKKLTQVVKPDHHSPAELELFDFLDADEFLVAGGNQEVPNLSAVTAHDSSTSSEFDLLSSDYEVQEGDHAASADSFAAFFKGKAAHSHKVVADDGDQFLVPDAGLVDEFCTEAAPSDDAFFFPGDIPGLESFVPEMDLSSDDFSLSFDLALQTASSGVETFEGDRAEVGKPAAVATAQPHEFATGPFAKWFATKTRSELDEPMCAETIKHQARAMIKCCLEADESQKVPSLQLNMQDVLAAWSDRGEPWVDFKVPRSTSEDSASSGATTSSDAGVVPDLVGDESQSGGDRDARVLRYKEKRRTRLFSKKIRYEVRKLNAERRPRMKGRFVKRSAATAS